jgi:hypothetical protein
MFDDLISYDDCEESSEETFGFRGVTFLRDFGPWKKGDDVYSLWFYLDKAVVEEQAPDGDTEFQTIKSCKFRLTAAV